MCKHANWSPDCGGAEPTAETPLMDLSNISGVIKGENANLKYVKLWDSRAQISNNNVTLAS